MSRSALAVGFNSENACKKPNYFPDNVQEPIVAVADVRTFLFIPGGFFAAKVADFIRVIVNMIFCIKR